MVNSVNPSIPKSTVNPDIIRIRKPRKKLKTRDEKFWENFEEWVVFWRENPHRFCEYLNIKLKFFQKILMYMMNKYPKFIFISSRGLGKSWLCMVFCIVRCILYPNTKIAVVAAVKNQSKLFLEKVIDIEKNCPNIAKEISGKKFSDNETSITFHNGSTIKAVVCSDNARGYRANIVIVDEFAMADEDTIKKSIFAFLTSKRVPPYMDNFKEGTKEYEDLLDLESNYCLYLSSIRSKDEWSYTFLTNTLNEMFSGDMSSMATAMPYQFGIASGIIDKGFIKEYVKNNIDTPEIVRSEMECIPTGGAGNTFFTYQNISNCRDNVKVMVAKTDQEYIEFQDNPEGFPFYIPKLKGEIRFLAIDVAMIESPKNDNTALWIVRLIPKSQEEEKDVKRDKARNEIIQSLGYEPDTKYTKIVSYCESMHGINGLIQTKRIKQVFYEFECDYCVIDILNAGIGIFDAASKETYDAERGELYPAWTVVNGNDIKLASRVLSDNAVPVVYGVNASPTLNHKMISHLRNVISAGDISFPADRQEAVDHFNTYYKLYAIEDDDKRNRILGSFMQTTAFSNEITSLEVLVQSGHYRLQEKSTRRKDRVTSLMYGLYYIREFEESFSDSDDDTWLRILMSVTNISKMN